MAGRIRRSRAPRRNGAFLPRLGAVAALLVLALPAVDAVHAKDRHRRVTAGAERRGDPDFEWSWRIPAGKTLEIRGVNGSIRAERARGEAEVRAVKRAKRSDPREVRIEAIEHEDGVTVCAVYPGKDGVENVCAPGGGRMNTRNNDVVVDFHVRVPEGVRLVAATVNGAVDVHDLESPVEVATVNGSVSLATTRTAVATTVNGSVSAVVGSADWEESLSFGTVNGAIDVTFPSDLRAQVDATTVNGDIETDFALTVRGKFNRRHVRGRVGGAGGGELSLSTVNGSIHLRAAD